MKIKTSIQNESIDEGLAEKLDDGLEKDKQENF